MGPLHNLSGLFLVSARWELCLLQVRQLKWESTFKMLCLPRPRILWWVLFMVVLLLLFTLDLYTALYSLQSSFVDAITFDPVAWKLGRDCSSHLINEETGLQDRLVGGRAGTGLTSGHVSFPLYHTASSKYKGWGWLLSHLAGESLQEAQSTEVCRKEGKRLTFAQCLPRAVPSLFALPASCVLTATVGLRKCGL